MSICKDFYVMEIQGDAPDPSPLSRDTPVPGGLRESPPAPAAAETGCPAQASRPANAPHSPGAGRRASRGGGGGGERRDEEDERGVFVPAVVITQADEGRRAAANQPGGDGDTVQPEGAASANASSSSSSQANGGDPARCDLQSLRSDSVSLSSEPANSGKSDGEQDCQEDDVRSVTTSSVTSLFQRLQLDPLEREWLRLAAVGDAAALRQLLSQDPTLASKKTALHWAAKQGGVEMAEMMARAGADVNAKSGYTALHLAALHGHPHIIQLLLHTYNAKANIRDYHGKTPVHYWSGSVDVFGRPGSQSCGTWSRGRRAQRYPQLPSLLLSARSRTRSHGHLNLELTTTTRERTPAHCGRPRSPS